MHSLKGLKRLPDESIDMIITSPPYYNMRDYGKTTETIWDEQAGCKHVFGKPIVRKRRSGDKGSVVYNNRKGVDQFNSSSQFCIKCGAWKGQLGLEPDFHLYIKHLLDIFEEVKRVLKIDGTCWINIGDIYGTSNIRMTSKAYGQISDSQSLTHPVSKLETFCHRRDWNKCLLGLPERFILGMIQRGWILRNKINWHKPNHIPSPVKDRFTQTWEYMLVFTKSKKYYFDLDTVRVPRKREIPTKKQDYELMNGEKPKGKNPGDFWSIATKPFKEAHFAVFPEQLIERPILAGCPGCACSRNKHQCKSKCANCTAGIVLDPFMGSGTTAVVAQKLGRNFIGFEPNPEYIKIARKRLWDSQQKKKTGKR